MDPTKPSPIDYQGSGSVPPRLWNWQAHVMSIVGTGFLWLVLTLTLFVIVPVFERIFRDFKTELPGITKLILAGSRWYRNQFGILIVLVLLAAVVGVGLVIDANALDARPARRYALAVLIVCLLLAGTQVALFAMGMFMPMANLMQAVGGK